MPTRFDPFTGEPLDRPQGPQRREGDDVESLFVSGEERQQGTIVHGHPHQDRRYGMAVAVPLVIVALISPIAVGIFTIFLAARGTIEVASEVLVPALILGGTLGSVAGVAGAFLTWRRATVQGPLRTILFGALTSTVVLGLVVLSIGLVFG